MLIVLSIIAVCLVLLVLATEAGQALLWIAVKVALWAGLLAGIIFLSALIR